MWTVVLAPLPAPPVTVAVKLPFVSAFVSVDVGLRTSVRVDVGDFTIPLPAPRALDTLPMVYLLKKSPRLVARAFGFTTSI